MIKEFLRRITKNSHDNHAPITPSITADITSAYTLIPIDFHGGGIGKRINSEDGTLEAADGTTMTTFKVYHIQEGDIVEVINKNYEFKLATYREGPADHLIYTYCYQSEENWTIYNNDFIEDDNYLQTYTSKKDTYIRIQLRRCDKGTININLDTEPVIHIKSPKTARITKAAVPYPCKTFFADEIRKTATAILKEKEAIRAEGKDTITLALLADTHYVMGGTFEDTLSNLKAVHSQAPFDAVLHLGDLTDGMSTKAVARDFSQIVLDGLRELGTPVYPVIGNHDTNYFKGNPDVLTEEEQAAMYLQDIGQANPRYYVDFEDIGLRLIIFNSFDSKEKVRYGFNDRDVSFLEDTLSKTPKTTKVLVCAHVPLLPKMHYWSKEIRNHEKILALIQKHNEKHGTILGYVHGHNHSDQINTEYGFPIVSIGCNKLEYFTDYKPEGSVTYERKMCDETQDLWDALIITPSRNRLAFIRFGAGEDRVVENPL
ncbi:metallophosphoesterase family protein [Butyrivibrio sp. WCD2001]|uniref:metallophosphoesterase family protein n=1 Tax=Butyrivibrio sp. WCD2001 TaxID=1280681 RepID=UPI000406CFDE|nr:metallophosphoesterase [Butyrivibrio sp. WCD2001]